MLIAKEDGVLIVHGNILTFQKQLEYPEREKKEVLEKKDRVDKENKRSTEEGLSLGVFSLLQGERAAQGGKNATGYNLGQAARWFRNCGQALRMCQSPSNSNTGGGSNACQPWCCLEDDVVAGWMGNIRR